MGVALGHTLLAYGSCSNGLGKLEVNPERLMEDLEDAWEVLAEPIQTVMRRHGVPDSYEQLKELTRGKEGINRDTLHKFIDDLALPETEKKRLREMMPRIILAMPPRWPEKSELEISCDCVLFPDFSSGSRYRIALASRYQPGILAAQLDNQFFRSLKLEKPSRYSFKLKSGEAYDRHTAPQSRPARIDCSHGRSQCAPKANENKTAEPAGETMPSLEQLLKKAELDAQEHHDAWLRAKADAENIRKRAQIDITNAHKYAIENFSTELLAVMDSLEAALAVENATVENFKSGMELTLKQLTAVFDKFNIKLINPEGEKFDPHLHQAMCTVDSDLAPNTVVQVMQKGYVLNDRVIRPALVSVSKAKESLKFRPSIPISPH